MTDPDRELLEVENWLRAQPGGEALHLVVQRSVGWPEAREAAYLLLVGAADETRRHELRAQARRALLALGWRVVLASGRDLYDVHAEAEGLTAHERLAAMALVQDALDRSGP